jgi:hypothetical protein
MPSAGGKPVVQDRQQDPRVRVEPEGKQRPPSNRTRKVHLLGEGHFGQAPGEVPVGRAAHLRVDPRIGREPRQVLPKSGV